MIPYWIMLLSCMFGAIPERGKVYQNGRALRSDGALIILMLTLLIGFRYEVGGDWHSYLDMFHSYQTMSWGTALLEGDPAYVIFNKISDQLGWGIIGVNLFCATLFSWGVVKFCWHQPRPMLGLTVAIPYLIIVVGMGYSRQAVAIGCALLALVALAEKRYIVFILWMILAALFHKTAAVLFPIIALASSKNKVWTIVWGSVFTIGIYLLLLQSSVDSFMQNYVEAQMKSEGALIRVFMNVIPAGLFLLLRKRFALPPEIGSLWTWLSAIAVACLLILIAMPSISTTVDRLALYLIPVQIFVFSRLPDAFFASRKNKRPVIDGVCVYSLMVMFVWLNFAANSKSWLPYQFYPLELLTKADHIRMLAF